MVITGGADLSRADSIFLLLSITSKNMQIFQKVDKDDISHNTFNLRPGLSYLQLTTWSRLGIVCVLTNIFQKSTLSRKKADPGWWRDLGQLRSFCILFLFVVATLDADQEGWWGFAHFALVGWLGGGGWEVLSLYWYWVASSSIDPMIPSIENGGEMPLYEIPFQRKQGKDDHTGINVQRCKPNFNWDRNIIYENIWNNREYRDDRYRGGKLSVTYQSQS